MRKKRKNKKRKVVKTIILLVIFVIIILGGYILINDFMTNKLDKGDNNKPNDKPKETVLVSKFDNDIKYSTDYYADEFANIEDKVVEMMNLYYQSIYYLRENDFSSFFSIEKESYLFNKAVKLQIESRKSEKNDLKMTKASYDLDFIDIDKTNDGYKVIVNENAYLNYNFMKTITTKLYNIENIFEFDNNYKLLSFRRSQDFYLTFTEELDDNFTKEDVDNLYNEYSTKRIKNINDRENLYNLYLENKDYQSKTCSHNYNRTKAQEYASSYVNIRNINNWDVYDNYGGNCQNFASQVLYAGGIPRDIYGAHVWKYYSATPDNGNNYYGRSASWTTVGYFYEYAKNNTGYGLCAEVDANLYYAESGDVMQIGDEGMYYHTVVVYDTIQKDGNVIDVLVNSNTNDYENVPISSIFTSEFRLIKINGWND